LVDIEEFYVRDLYKKHKGKEYYKVFYTVRKKIYKDEADVMNESIALNEETLTILKARIEASLLMKAHESNAVKTRLIFYCLILQSSLAIAIIFKIQR